MPGGGWRGGVILSWLILSTGVLPAQADSSMNMYFLCNPEHNCTIAGSDTISTTYVVNWTRQSFASAGTGGVFRIRNAAGVEITQFTVTDQLSGTVVNPGLNNWSAHAGSWLGDTYDYVANSNTSVIPGWYSSVSGGGTITTVREELPLGATVPPSQHYDETYTYNVNFFDAPPPPTPTPGPNTKPCDKKSGGDQPDCSSCHGMARYSVHSQLVSLNVHDTPLRYAPPYGPAIDFSATYNQRESQQPATFNYSNLGPKWTFNWLSYVSDSPTAQLPLTGVYQSGGGAEIFAF